MLPVQESFATLGSEIIGPLGRDSPAGSTNVWAAEIPALRRQATMAITLSGVLPGYPDRQHPGRPSAAGDRPQPHAITSLPELFGRHDVGRRLFPHDARSCSGGIGRDDPLGGIRAPGPVLPRTIFLLSPPRAAPRMVPRRIAVKTAWCMTITTRTRIAPQRVRIAVSGAVTTLSGERFAVGFGSVWFGRSFAGRRSCAGQRGRRRFRGAGPAWEAPALACSSRPWYTSRPTP